LLASLVKMRKKTALFLLLVAVLAFAASMEMGFRAYLYRSLGHASLVAGSLPNFVAVLLLALVYALPFGSRKQAGPRKAAGMATFAMVAYEGVQPWIPGRVFDANDLLASLLGGLLAYLALTAVDLYCQPRRVRR
jgi:VanZ family protein